ncbi:AraC family transcriptional regulator [Rufibacter hautae]|uniref:AraC family transcriptional regulator n=1 Tax=Rufibacter hautae TaxID=2595005 RepID=A0A5B6TKK6_9BACT|nr:AraC family transcriptional regulator [Rufibacter hautae]KAA3440516.1 AraC family transcriptional regulator [Rufibacter hautae]
MAHTTSYRQIPPPPHLAEYVRHFWIAEGQDISAPYHFSSVANGCAQLTFHYKGSFMAPGTEQTVPEFYLQGPSSKPTKLVTQESFGILGAALYPYTASLLFKTPGQEVRDQARPMQEMLGSGLRQLEEQITTSASTEERLDLLVQFLTEQLLQEKNPDAPLQQLIKAEIDAGQQPDVENLYEQMHTSRRQFERRFKNLLGFSPREYAKIQRFRYALQQYLEAPNQSFTQLALNSGYYDQAHFNRDFKELSGVTPRTFFSEDPQDPGLRI